MLPWFISLSNIYDNILKNIIKIKWVKKMKKLIIVLTVLLAICLTVSAVSAEDGSWGFKFSSDESSSSNSNGGSIEFKNGELTVQGLKFAIPDGFKENETAKAVGEQADQNSFPGSSISVDRFDKGNESVIVKVVYNKDKNLGDDFVANNNTVSKKIANHDGYFLDYDDGVSFTYIDDGKVVEIFAPSEDTISSVIK